LQAPDEAYDYMNRQGNKGQFFKGRYVRWDFLNHLTIERLITRMSFYEMGIIT